MGDDPSVPKARKGQGSVELTRQEFLRREKEWFYDPAFEKLKETQAVVSTQAWENYQESRKSPRASVAGPGFSDPDFELAQEWLEAREQIRLAQEKQLRPDQPDHILLINASPRSDQTCPGEMSKSHRLAELARKALEEREAEVNYLDLSRLASEYGKRIYPCKSCVSTAMPLCHWPCSCYPNHALGQVQDWMNEIYPMWKRAHGILIVSPVHWYSPPSGLKLMMDRLVCADGGNPDPTTTQGKTPELAKELELKGWSYPRHLSGRRYGVLVHGDAEGAGQVRTVLTSWMRDMGLVSAGPLAEIDRYVGYYEPYATSHDALDRDEAIQKECEMVANALIESVQGYRQELRARSLEGAGLMREEDSSWAKEVRPK